MVRSIILFAISLAASSGADAQAAPQVGPRLDLNSPAAPADCGSQSGRDVVVCGNRQRSPYRPDETVLDAQRSEDAANNPSRVQDRSGDTAMCGTGRNECSGGMIPLLGPALRVATAIVDAATGQDWRQAFRNGPSDYDRYQDAKRTRGKISIGISAGNSGQR
jgi:hypothetical protein